MTTKADFKIYGSYINGTWVDSGEYLPVLNKYSGEQIGKIAITTKERVNEAITSAEEAFHNNPLSPSTRFEILNRVSQLIKERKEALTRMIVLEAGKPYREASVEVERAANTFLIAAEEGKRICGEMIPIVNKGTADARVAYTLRKPVGVVCCISPFNFPLNLVAHKVAPALAAGNTVVLKPASTTPLTSAMLAEIFADAGLPKGHFHLVVGGGSSVGEWLLQDERIAHYTFTGSPDVGKHIRKQVGIRHVTLELGSNSATIVHEDANLEAAAAKCAVMAFANAGQICISVQRIYVHQNVYDAFQQVFVAEVKKLVVGDPLDPATQVGPMISESEAKRAIDWVSEAESLGAKVLTGGTRKGTLVQPTVLREVTSDMKVVCEEIFAPVVSLVAYQDLYEAIKLVNKSKYGLQAGIFTSSLKTAFEAADKIEVGGVMINDTSVYRADEMPYGGIKDSGVGREGPKYAIMEMTEPKVIVVNHNI
ncbi:aldehyde dehydrogenase family protein [Brevibacillus sp. SYSU BS000544]|uniref:aldehyde dehydrogenase family protein n=1 Tax=Brevibacillus sp. SYSU BS000544 TaxID=3416443 RepID=UPI003CE485DD